MKILSYSFFEPKSMPSHRSWDKYKHNIDRYYFNIPAVVLTNKILYPDHITKIYITDNVYNNILSEIFTCLKDFIIVQDININYNLTEPSILRMYPLWESGIDIFHTRDIDSIPTEIEYRYTLSFERGLFSIGTLRTHQNHFGPGCKMLAGLSSFRPQNIPIYIKGPSFIDYFNKNHGRYGCDQDLMIETFTKDYGFTALGFYDCKAYNQIHPQDFPCIQCEISELTSIPIEQEKELLFNTMKRLGFDQWAGEPIDARGEYTDLVLNKFPEIKRSITNKKFLKDFYGL